MSGNLHQKYIRGELLNVNCSSRHILKRLTGRWSVLVLLALKQDVLRFSELRRKIGGVSERMLAQTLRHMEQDGFIARKAYDVVPPHVEYWLTPLGYEAEQKLIGLADWLEDNVQRIQQNREDFDQRREQQEP